MTAFARTCTQTRAHDEHGASTLTLRYLCEQLGVSGRANVRMRVAKHARSRSHRHLRLQRGACATSHLCYRTRFASKSHALQLAIVRRCAGCNVLWLRAFLRAASAQHRLIYVSTR
eukprot:12883351-Alexandrium_andersonii.AAC.1